MVCLRQSAACQRGRHEECSGQRGTPAGRIGGFICTCRCHRELQREDEEVRHNRSDLVSGVHARSRRLNAVLGEYVEYLRTGEWEMAEERLKVAHRLMDDFKWHVEWVKGELLPAEATAATEQREGECDAD